MADIDKLLQTLHPMREPPPPAPITPTLVMCAAGVCLALSIFAAVWYLRHRHGALRQAALDALQASRSLASEERLAAHAVLLRRLVRGLDRTGDARQEGRAWLETLDRVFATRFFTEGAGSAYGESLYRRPADARAADLRVTELDALDAALGGLIAKVRA